MRGLYAIVDPQVCVREPILVARDILRGGCAALQLRDKTSDDRTFAHLGRALAPLCEAARIPLILNDRFWLVHEVGAQGAHIGQTDTPIETVRTEVGARCSIGLSSNTLAQAQDAAARGADLIGFGPIFATTSKVGADPVVGVVALAEVCRSVRVPVVAIGGIDLARASSIVQAGAPLGAAISALCAVPDSEHAARELHARLQ